MLENNENAVILITKKGFCPACMLTKQVLSAKGIKFIEKHLDDNIALKNHLHDLGIMQYPIVITNPDDKFNKKTTWWGFRPEKINALAK